MHAVSGRPRGLGEHSRGLATRHANDHSPAGRTPEIRRAKTSEGKRSLEGHGVSVNSAVLPRDGTSGLTASAQTAAELGSAETGECTRTLKRHGTSVNSAVFPPDGSSALPASTGRIAKLLSDKR